MVYGNRRLMYKIHHASLSLKSLRKSESTLTFSVPITIRESEDLFSLLSILIAFDRSYNPMRKLEMA